MVSNRCSDRSSPEYLAFCMCVRASSLLSVFDRENIYQLLYFTIIITGKPPAFSGDSQGLTVLGMRSLHRLNRSKLKQTEASVEHLGKPKPLGMGLQVPRGWIPKFRKKVLYGQLRVYMGGIIRELARQKESRVVEGTMSTCSSSFFQNTQWHR